MSDHLHEKIHPTDPEFAHGLDKKRLTLPSGGEDQYSHASKNVPLVKASGRSVLRALILDKFHLAYGGFFWDEVFRQRL